MIENNQKRRANGAAAEGGACISDYFTSSIFMDIPYIYIYIYIFLYIPAYIPWIFLKYFLYIFHLFSLGCILIHSVNRKTAQQIHQTRYTINRATHNQIQLSTCTQRQCLSSLCLAPYFLGGGSDTATWWYMVGQY